MLVVIGLTLIFRNLRCESLLEKNAVSLVPTNTPNIATGFSGLKKSFKYTLTKTHSLNARIQSIVNAELKL